MKNKKNNTGLELVISNRKVKPENNKIVIYPAKGGWNDFGYKIRCYFVSNISNNFYEGELLFGFMPFEKDDEKTERKKSEIGLSAWIRSQRQNTDFISKDDLPDFFTLLPDMQSYRKLVSHYEPGLANKVLMTLNDLVVNKLDSGAAQWVKIATDSDVFSLGFMRNSEPFFAFHNAESILDGLDEEKFDVISNSLTLNFKLDGFNNEHKVHLKYADSSIIPKRINVLIGKNGLGKSQCLNQFCRSALRYKDAENNLNGPNSSRPMINRLLVIGTPGETSNTFPAERINTQKMFYRRLNITRNSRSRTSRKITELLTQLARSNELLGDEYRWDIFISALRRIIDVNKLTIKLKDGSYCKLEDLEHGVIKEQHKLVLLSNIDISTEPRFSIGENHYPLSSGQLTFFKFALLCSLYIENGSFVLMDEPETHLHPNLISEFVDLLDHILEQTGSYALIATHSVFFVREISREQVHVFRSGVENDIIIGQPRLRTFGANIDSISEFVFEDEIENRLTNKVIKRVSDRDFKSVDEEIGSEISLSSLMAIRDHLEGRKQ